MVPCKRTVEEVSFEWSHHRISPTDSKVRITLHVSIIDSVTVKGLRIKTDVLPIYCDRRFSNTAFCKKFRNASFCTKHGVLGSSLNLC